MAAECRHGPPDSEVIGLNPILYTNTFPVLHHLPSQSLISVAIQTQLVKDPVSVAG